MNKDDYDKFSDLLLQVGFQKTEEDFDSAETVYTLKLRNRTVKLRLEFAINSISTISYVEDLLVASVYSDGFSAFAFDRTAVRFFFDLGIYRNELTVDTLSGTVMWGCSWIVEK